VHAARIDDIGRLVTLSNMAEAEVVAVRG